MEKIISIDQLDLSKIYSYADYLLWDLKERVELIKGKIFKMSPAPSEEHQRTSLKIIHSCMDVLEGGQCNLYHAPFDVRIPLSNADRENEIYTVVQPDITVICDPSKIDEKGCLGAPDIVFEILSKSSIKKDLHEKYNLYESSGVKEYWIVDPMAQTIQVNAINENGKYSPGRLLTRGEVAKSHIIAGLNIEIDSVFPQILEEPEGYYGPNVKRI